MNGREIRRLGVSRRQLFETIERPAMQSLPEQDYEYAEWRFARVGIDYHVEVKDFFYSAPHALIREQVDTRVTTRSIEIFYRGKRVASHARRYTTAVRGTARRPTTCPVRTGAMPNGRPNGFARQARDIGPNT
jgi:hypothetical protein